MTALRLIPGGHQKSDWLATRASSSILTATMTFRVLQRGLRTSEAGVKVGVRNKFRPVARRNYS